MLFLLLLGVFVFFVPNFTTNPIKKAEFIFDMFGAIFSIPLSVHNLLVAKTSFSFLNGYFAWNTISFAAYYRGAMGILLVYDVTDESSFNSNNSSYLFFNFPDQTSHDKPPFVVNNLGLIFWILNVLIWLDHFSQIFEIGSEILNSMPPTMSTKY